MRIAARILIPFLSLAVAACATTGAGRGDIAFDATSKGQLLAGANCVVRTAAGSWNVVTPAVVNVGNASGDLHVVCDKPGYRTSELVYTPSYGSSGSSVGIGLGGGGSHVGVGVGLSMPISGGSGRYPSRVTIDMNPQ